MDEAKDAKAESARSGWEADREAKAREAKESNEDSLGVGEGERAASTGEGD